MRSETLKETQRRYHAKLKIVTVHFPPAEYAIYDKLQGIAERSQKSVSAVVKEMIREL